MEFHSDRELGDSSTRNVENISKKVWCGIRELIQRCIDNNGLAKDFPLICPDGTDTYGCDKEKLNRAICSVIPRIEGIDTYEQQEAEDYWRHEQVEEEQATISDEERTYDILDLTEFIYSHLYDSIKAEEPHEYYSHYHLKFIEGNSMKEAFRENINDIFRRNKIAYELSSEGKIERTIPISQTRLFKVKHNTKDEELNNMLGIAVNKFLSPKIEDRRIALEKLWDAFERLKTIECTPENRDKSASAEIVLSKMGSDNNEFRRILSKEMRSTLTNIGNEFMIRHFETDKIMIEDPDHIDYLFYRMMSLVNLFLAKYNQ